MLYILVVGYGKACFVDGRCCGKLTPPDLFDVLGSFASIWSGFKCCNVTGLHFSILSRIAAALGASPVKVNGCLSIFSLDGDGVKVNSFPMI